MSKHPTSGNRLSKQNYCTFCQYRVKREDGVYCINLKFHIKEAMEHCPQLHPFDAYKKAKSKV